MDASSSNKEEDSGRIYEDGWCARWDALRAAWLSAKERVSGKRAKTSEIRFVFLLLINFLCLV